MNLDHRAEFQMRANLDTGMGLTQGDWATQFCESVSVKYLRGTESVMAARMESRNPVVITVRNSARARLITSDWQVVIRDRSGLAKTCVVKEEPRPTEFSGFLEMLCEG